MVAAALRTTSTRNQGQVSDAMCWHRYARIFTNSCHRVPVGTEVQRLACELVIYLCWRHRQEEVLEDATVSCLKVHDAYNRVDLADVPAFGCCDQI